MPKYIDKLTNIAMTHSSIIHLYIIKTHYYCSISEKFKRKLWELESQDDGGLLKLKVLSKDLGETVFLKSYEKTRNNVKSMVIKSICFVYINTSDTLCTLFITNWRVSLLMLFYFFPACKEKKNQMLNSFGPIVLVAASH